MARPTGAAKFRWYKPCRPRRQGVGHVRSQGVVMVELPPGRATDQDQPPPLGIDSPDLRASLADLAGLVSGAGGAPAPARPGIHVRAHAIPGADGSGVTLLRVERPDNLVEALTASHPFVAEIDEIQYVTLGEGPASPPPSNDAPCGRARRVARRCGRASAPGWVGWGSTATSPSRSCCLSESWVPSTCTPTPRTCTTGRRHR